jgi:hypothetical protein
MLKIFHLDVSKVVLSVAHVTMATPACFKSIFQVLNQFQTYVANFYLDFLKIDLVLHMLQWCRWLADNGLLQGFDSYLARCALAFPFLYLPSLFFSSISPWQFELGGGTLPDERTNAE